MLDLYNNSAVDLAKDLSLINTETTTVGNIVDLAGYEGVVFCGLTGTVTTGDGYTIIQEGDAADLADAATAPAASVQGGIILNAGDNDIVRRMAYRGGKRYVRPAFVSDGTFNGRLMIASLKLRPAVGPTAAQST